MMIPYRPLLFVTFCTALSFLLGGCKLALLEPKGLIAADEKQLLITAVALMLIVVIPVIFLTLLFAWRYRAGNTNATYAPTWSHNTWIEVVCWAIPLVIITILGILTWTSCHRLDPYKPLASDDKTLTIQVVSLQWKWLFIYPEQGIASLNTLHIPINKPIKFLITAEGPMNSFQIPQLGGQIYAMAGMQTKLHLIANEVGDYAGMATNFTGDGFTDMSFRVHASTNDEFEKWVTMVRKNATSHLTLSEYAKLIQPSIKDEIKYFHLEEKNIFALSMMKSMMPMEKTCESSSNNVSEKKAAQHA